MPELPDPNPWADTVRSFVLDDTPDDVVAALCDLLESLPAGDPAGSLESIRGAYDHAATFQPFARFTERAHGEWMPTDVWTGTSADRASVDSLDRATDDGAPAPTPAPDPWTGDQHRVRVGRNKRGTTRKVTARGVGSVIGARFRTVDGGTVPTEVVDRLLTVRPRANGWNVLDVTRAADDLYPELPDLAGTDAMAWQVVSLTDLSDDEMASFGRFRTDMLSFLVQGSDIPTGRKSTTVPREMYRTDAANLVGPASLAPWPVKRRTVRPRRRASEARYLAPFHGVRLIAAPFQPVTLARLWTSAGAENLYGGTGEPGDQDAPVFIGHSPMMVRGPLAPTNAESTRGNRERATVAENLPVPATVGGWETWAESLANGARVSFRDATYRVTLTRTAAGRFTGRVVHGDDVVRFTVRTTTAIARRLAIATAA